MKRRNFFKLGSLGAFSLFTPKLISNEIEDDGFISSNEIIQNILDTMQKLIKAKAYGPYLLKVPDIYEPVLKRKYLFPCYWYEYQDEFPARPLITLKDRILNINTLKEIKIIKVGHDAFPEIQEINPYIFEGDYPYFHYGCGNSWLKENQNSSIFSK